MRYKVTGADRTTGELTSRVIEGKTPAEAEAVASFTMLVSAVTPEEPPPEAVPYAVPVAKERFAGVNWARGIGFYSGVLRILSYPVAAMGLWLLLASLWSALRSLMSMMSMWFILGEDGWTFLSGLLLVSTAVFMQLAAMVALAIRDVAVWDDAGAGPRP